MTKTTWLLAGAALAVCAGGAIAATGPEDAAREAEADSRQAVVESRAAREEAREARERARELREDARDLAEEAAERAREAAEHAREAAREAARMYRGDGDVVFVSRGWDRADYLADVLQLRPEQRPALETFLAATRSERRDAMVRFDHDRESGRTTLQRLDEMQARMAAQQAEAGRKIAAIKAFYGQLDASQKQAFDRMPMLMMVGPSMGPMILPARMPIAHLAPPPPAPPRPPAPPTPPSSL